MKVRSATKLLRQVDAWHGHLTRGQDVVFQSWHSGPIRPWTMEEQTAELGSLRWSVQKLLSSWELAAKGTVLNHCVVSYSDQCADGQTSVWSIGLQRPGQEARESVLTVAVDVQRRVTTQARGRHNMLPGQAPRSAQTQQAVRGNYLQMWNRSDHVLRLWMERERIRRDD
jgi:hypothetical protein